MSNTLPHFISTSPQIKLIKEKHFNYLMTRHNFGLSAKILRVCVTLTVAVRCVECAVEEKQQNRGITTNRQTTYRPTIHITVK